MCGVRHGFINAILNGRKSIINILPTEYYVSSIAIRETGEKFMKCKS